MTKLEDLPDDVVRRISSEPVTAEEILALMQQVPPELFDTLSSAEMWLMSRLEPQDWPTAFRQRVEEHVILGPEPEIDESELPDVIEF
ncbi:MAG: hypothetical protein U1F71_03455 [Verrucomicrobiaceae bacterium]